MSSAVSLSIVVPAYNEAQSIAALVDEMLPVLEGLGRQSWK